METGIRLLECDFGRSKDYSFCVSRVPSSDFKSDGWKRINDQDLCPRHYLETTGRILISTQSYDVSCDYDPNPTRSLKGIYLTTNASGQFCMSRHGPRLAMPKYGGYRVEEAPTADDTSLKLSILAPVSGARLGGETRHTFCLRNMAVEAHRWFRNGDHPLDECVAIPVKGQPDLEATSEGKVVKRWNAPVRNLLAEFCKACDQPMTDHGMVDNQAQQVVCPGSWIVTNFPDNYSVYSDEFFRRTFERVIEIE